MSNQLYILAIDGPDYYAATLHNDPSSAHAELVREVRDNGLLPTPPQAVQDDDETYVIIEWLQDQGVETNLTLATVPA